VASRFFFPLLFIPHGLERFAGGMLLHEVPAFSWGFTPPTSFAGSGASQLPHSHGLLIHGTNLLMPPLWARNIRFKARYFSLSPLYIFGIHPPIKIGGLLPFSDKEPGRPHNGLLFLSIETVI
jgi:hypothetical protein